MNASSSTLNLALLTSDATPRLADGAAYDYLLIESVRALRASAAVAAARARRVEQDMVDAGLIPPAPVPKGAPADGAEGVGNRASMGSTMASVAVGKGKAEPGDEEEEEVRKRLEAIGLHVGSNLTERLTRDRAPFNDTLDSIKFICKELWAALWDKQVDNLRTNHRGVYVLQDNSFKPVYRISSFEGRAEAARKAKLYAAMPGGMIKGALGRLGLTGSVTPELTNLPGCTFQVKLR